MKIHPHTHKEKKYFCHETSIVDSGAEIGENTKIWHFSHICSGASIGKNCSIGQNVFIAPGVNIGNNVKIQNGVSVYTGVEVEDYAFLGPHCVFTNDLYPRSFGDWKISNTKIKKGASIGANATILCGTEIGEFAMVGCGSVVTKDVPPKTLVVGNPAKFKKVLKDKNIELL
jgi:acetyltransferase-like isoleucine patch superfamily enzyme